jgi:acyl-CoA hydrolase
MSHYLAQMSTLNALLLGISYGDAIHIISLYGMVSNTSCTITCTIYSQNIKLVNVLHSFFIHYSSFILIF